MKSQTNRVKAHDDQLEALNLRKAGLSYSEIAARTNYKTAQTAWRAVESALNRTIREPAEDVRTLELERLDRLQLGAWPDASRGHLGAIDRVLRIMERRAKLLGLDAPDKQQHSGDLRIVMDWGDSADTDDRAAETA